MSNKMSILLFYKFRIFVAKALIYGDKKRSYFDHKSQQHCLYIVASTPINMLGRCYHKMNRANRTSTRLFCWDMMSRWSPKTVFFSNWHWDKLPIKAMRKSESGFIWYFWIKLKLWGYDSWISNTCLLDFALSITKIVAKYAYK